MSDVIAAALIAGGVGLAGNVTTYFATKRQANAALAAARVQSQRDLDRLAAEHYEGERQSRRDTYRLFITTINELDGWAQGFGQARTRDNFNAWLSEYRASTAAIRLISAWHVQDALDRLVDVLSEFADPLLTRDAEHLFEESVSPAYAKNRTAIRQVRDSLIDAMRRDLEAMMVKRVDNDGL